MVQDFSPHPQNMQVLAQNAISMGGGNAISQISQHSQISNPQQMMAKQDSIGDYVAMYQVQPINSRQKQQHSSTGHNTQNTVINRAANGSITKNSSTKADSAFDMYSKTPQAYSGMNRGSNLEPGFSPDHSTNEKQGNFSSQLQA